MPAVCRHSEGKQHSCSYVDERNKLIPEAEREAWAIIRVKNLPHGAFGREFMAAMERLAAIRFGGWLQ